MTCPIVPFDTIIEVQTLRPDLLLVDVRHGHPDDHRMRFTAVMSRLSGGWKIRAARVWPESSPDQQENHNLIGDEASHKDNHSH